MVAFAGRGECRVVADRRADDRFPPRVEPAHADIAGRTAIDLRDLDVEQDLTRTGDRDPIDDDEPSAAATAAAHPAAAHPTTAAAHPAAAHPAATSSAATHPRGRAGWS